MEDTAEHLYTSEPIPPTGMPTCYVCLSVLDLTFPQEDRDCAIFARGLRRAGFRA